MSKINQFLALFFILISHQLFAIGTIRGTVTDKGTGETVPFANIYILGEDVETGTTTNLEGNYKIDLPAGNYTITYSYLGYSNYKLEKIKVIDGKVKVIDVKIHEAGEVLAAVVVTAKQLRNTASSIAVLQNNSSNLLNGISSNGFSKIGDGNAADAIKRVSGVSTESGKYVYVRGLGDRYTKTTLNGMAIPGLNPDKNTVQMDIFPSNIIDNIIVYKSFTADLPADFTGGIVDIVTKFFPDEKSTDLSYSIGYNPQMNLNGGFLSYKGSKTDKWGFDDGTRALPFHKSTYIPDESSNNPELYRLSSSFSEEMAAKASNSGLNHSFSLSHGNQINLGKKSIGYIATVNYKNSFSHYKDALFENYIVNPSSLSLSKEDKKSGTISTRKVLLSTLLSTAFKTKQNEVAMSYMLIQNGEDKAAKLKAVNYDSNPSTILKDVLEYAQRTIHNIKLSGKHSFSEGKFKVNWALSPTWIEVDEPDIRSTGFELTSENQLRIQPSIGADISRTFRNLKEVVYNGTFDFEYKLRLGDEGEVKIKAGSNILSKERDFSIQNYVFRVKDQGMLNLDGNADNLFKDENLWNTGTEQGVYIKGNYEPSNTFNARQNILAAYMLTELKLSSNLKTVLGLRVEKVDNYYTGRNNLGTVVLNNEKVLDELDFLPSSNFIYTPRKGVNIRLSYNKTLARPSFKEKSIAQIQDRISGRTFIGNLELKETKISNIDLRWESFYSRAQMVSLSVFYKYLINPIELESYNELSPNNYTPRNQEKASVYGMEVEIRKNLTFIADAFSGFSVNMNASYLKSRIKRENTLAIYSTNTRQMVGLSPLLINFSVGYKNMENGFDINMGYNVQGQKLSIVGIGVNPDVYETPFHSLDAKASIKIGKRKQWKLSISAGNLLNAEKKLVFDGGTENTGEYIWSLFRPGRDFSMGLSYRFR